MSEARVIGEATNHEELVAALYARKEALGIQTRSWTRSLTFLTVIPRS